MNAPTASEERPDKITKEILLNSGWHVVHYNYAPTTNPRWCHGSIRGSYKFREAVKIYRERNAL